MNHMIPKLPDSVQIEAIKAKKATKKELIVVATMISRMTGTPVFSDRTEFSVTTTIEINRSAAKEADKNGSLRAAAAAAGAGPKST
jgi:hypothetical protein